MFPLCDSTPFLSRKCHNLFNKVHDHSQISEQPNELESLTTLLWFPGERNDLVTKGNCTKKSVAFLYTNNKQPTKEIKKKFIYNSIKILKF